MDRGASGELTVEQAKERLRAAARSASPLEALKAGPGSNPRASLLLAFLGGIVFGAAPESRRAIVKGMLELLLD